MMRTCDHEADVQTAAATGRWTAAVRAHAATCDTCADIALVVGALATPIPPLVRATNPARLFAEARFSRRLHAEAMISRVILGTQVASALLVLAVVACFVRPDTAWVAPLYTFAAASALALVVMLAAGARRPTSSRRSSTR